MGSQLEVSRTQAACSRTESQLHRDVLGREIFAVDMNLSFHQEEDFQPSQQN